MRTSFCATACIAAAVLLMVGNLALADLTDDGNGMPAWQGTLYMSGPMPGLLEVLAVEVDYSVYAPGFFGLSFPGLDPTGGADYIYAYQIFNDLSPHPSAGTGYDPDYVSRFSVGLDQDEAADNCDYLPGTGIAPDGVDVLSAGSTQSGWDFTLGQMAHSLAPPTVSAILFFSSPAPPEWDSTTVSGWQAATSQLPSPTTIPEPATSVLLAAGLCVLKLRRRRK